MAKIHVLLADDHAILREGLRSFLARQEDIEVVGEAQNGAEAVTRVDVLRPDIVLMDIAMPGMDGLQATRNICGQYPQTRVLVLTQHEDRQYVTSLLQAGASGYVPKRALGADLVSALRAVARGEVFLYPSVATILLEQVQPSSAPRANRVLTAREQQVLRQIAQGKTNPQIAADLSLSVKTVDWHRTNLMSKLNRHSVADLVRYAFQNGLAE